MTVSLPPQSEHPVSSLQPTGWLRYFSFSVDHKVIGLQYLLMARPRLCIFDEPSLGLAPKIVAEVGETIQRIKKMGKTILLVEQNSLMALRLADRAYLFEAGEIVLSGTGEELQSHPDVARAYLGH